MGGGRPPDLLGLLPAVALTPSLPPPLAVCTGRGHCQPQYASGSCSCDRGWGGHLCENDVMAPVFQRCPKDMHITGPGPKTKVTWQTPVATDNSDTPPTVEQKNGPANGADFSEGRTTVVYSATDDSGNQELCHFNVYVTREALHP